jgi:hypothetical protein
MHNVFSSTLTKEDEGRPRGIPLDLDGEDGIGWGTSQRFLLRLALDVHNLLTRPESVGDSRPPPSQLCTARQRHTRMAAGRKGTRQARALWMVLIAVAPAILTDQAEGSMLSDRPPFDPPGNQPQQTLTEPQDASEDEGMLGIYTGIRGFGEGKVKMVNENGYYIPEGAKGWDRIRAMARSSFARSER